MQLKTLKPKQSMADTASADVAATAAENA